MSRLERSLTSWPRVAPEQRLPWCLAAVMRVVRASYEKVKPLASSSPLPAHFARASSNCTRQDTLLLVPRVAPRWSRNSLQTPWTRRREHDGAVWQWHDLKALQEAINAVRYGVEYPHERRVSSLQT